MLILLYLIAFLLACFFTHLICQYALAKSLIDIPNQRSSHTIPTPRGGGLSIVIVFLAFFFILHWFKLITIETDQANAVILTGLLVSGVGFWDDHQPIPARWRLLVHALASLIALFFVPVLPTIPCFGWSINLSILGYLFYPLLLVWLLNLYNFMDGIDGIASTEAICVASSATVLLVMQHHTDWAWVLLLLAITIAGFLVWNWSPAKIFMGDACSGFLGFSFGLLALMTSATEAVNIWSWLILLALFISDASFTLVTRILNGQQWYVAHCSHAYQRYARTLTNQFITQGYQPDLARAKSHQRININLLLINLFWLFPLATIATFYPFWAIAVTVMAFLPLLLIAHTLKAGQVE
jgi:Fuc2NAc and GlcNAc transferase